MADNIPELVQCPYCGEEAYSDAESCSIFGNRTGHNYAIACRNCEASSPGKATMAEAIEAWNTRAAPKVKPLVWAQSATGVEGECHSVPTQYRIRYDEEWGWRWSRDGAFGVEVTHSGAVSAAQADHESRILSALQ